MKNKFLLILTSIIIFSLAFLVYKGYIWPNKLFISNYTVRGIDVSHYQNKIDWEAVQKQGVDFAYIKATEGINFEDPLFKKNWDEAKKYGIKRGAYHYFTFTDSGADQADNFIIAVPKEDDTLPPVIDLEFVGNSNNIPSKEKLNKELKSFIEKIEKRFNQKPILYLTYDSYREFIEGDFLDYKIWIRDIVKPPKLENRGWVFWQYSNRGRIDGINTYVDLDVYFINDSKFNKIKSQSQ